jgi:4-hydroxythreonine-4-phosphate dehydrogenase
MIHRDRNAKSTLPTLAVTVGDPTGIGPEIIVGALKDPSLYRVCRPLVVGRPEVLHRAMGQLGSPMAIDSIEDPSEGKPGIDRIACLTCGSPNAIEAPQGMIDARGGQAAYDALLFASRLALADQVEGIVTAPLHKVALHQAGHDWPGHTELLAEICGVQQYAMMLYLPPREDRKDPGLMESGAGRGGRFGLGVIHVTLHMALREIFAAIDPDAVFEKVSLAREVFSRLRRAYGESQEPSIAVAALNPHGGEMGRFGDEESTCIAPAVERARRLGWDVEGPLPVDTLMPRAVQGEFDAVVAMYHDQGHIALKLLDMFDAVNITLGLPILRTSVAHGTAHSIAGTATAKCSGMVQAILAAARLARGGWREDARRSVQQGNFAGG